MPIQRTINIKNFEMATDPKKKKPTQATKLVNQPKIGKGGPGGTSPYYEAQKAGGAKAAIAKREMANYFSGKSPANKRGETEAQHMSRMRKIDSTEQAKRKGPIGMKGRG